MKGGSNFNLLCPRPDKNQEEYYLEDISSLSILPKKKGTTFALITFPSFGLERGFLLVELSEILWLPTSKAKLITQSDRLGVNCDRIKKGWRGICYWIPIVGTTSNVLGRLLFRDISLSFIL